MGVFEAAKKHGICQSNVSRATAESGAGSSPRAWGTAKCQRPGKLIAQRTAGREGGAPGLRLFVLPRAVAQDLRARGLLRIKPVDDMLDIREFIFQPGAREILNRLAISEDITWMLRQ